MCKPLMPLAPRLELTPLPLSIPLKCFTPRLPDMSTMQTWHVNHLNCPGARYHHNTKRSAADTSSFDSQQREREVTMLTFTGFPTASQPPSPHACSCLSVRGRHPSLLGIHLLKASAAAVDACTVTVMGVLLRVLPVPAPLQFVVPHTAEAVPMRMR